MPSPLPSSFASAAAGNPQDSSSPASRRDGLGSGEWSRNRINGATQTFRRPSLATNVSHSRENVQSASSTSNPSVAAYIPPHLNSSYQRGTNDNRYNKELLLNLYKHQRESKDWGKNLTDHFMASWDPREERPPTNGSWGKRDDSKDNHWGPEVCWDHNGEVSPLAFTEMNTEEKELFSTSVNSPLKPPPQNSKDGSATGGVLGRKSSISQGHMNTFNSSSPASARPTNRRRGTGDSGGNNTLSPTPNSRFMRDEPNTATPPPSLLRRKTDFRDSTTDAKYEDREKPAGDRENPLDISSPFGSLKRSVTNPVGTGIGGSTSPWGPPSQGSAFSAMGGFGKFALGPLGSPASQPPQGLAEKKTSVGSMRGESRFKNLLSKSSSEDIAGSMKEKPALTNLDRLPETEDDKSLGAAPGDFRNRPTRSETNPFAEELRSGSAALGGHDISPPAPGIDQFGLSAFGMPSGSSFRDLMPSQTATRTPSRAHGNEPMSPTNTNPYQSPHGERVNNEGMEVEGTDLHRPHLPNISDLRDDSAPGPFSAQRGHSADIAPADRSQTSSVGAGRGFPSLGGLGGLSSLGNNTGWPSGSASGTPTRERSAFTGGFADPIFGSIGDFQPPVSAGLGGGGIFGSHTSLSNLGASTRTSKLGSLFPTAMQDQMRNEQPRSDDGSMRPQDPFMSPDTSSSFNIPTPGTSQPLGATTGPGPISANQPPPEGGSQTPQTAGGSSGPIPPAQQRQMVMPDRMRWIYRDPQGNVQGPWSGLEMHDWFKAGFFTAELQVKKLEEIEYEPLAQLVRRIGNSREPFLVPQIGVPHGQPLPQPGPTWGPAQPGGAMQPPFANSFPSFGTTLTAEQQNALERRKQEEQYLMARQKEHLAQQQALMKQMQVQTGSHTIHPQLQHHSSAHSLQSQPSYGSITSPGGFQQPPAQGPIQPPQSVPGYFEAPSRQNTLPNMSSQMSASEFTAGQDELPTLLDRLNVNRGSQFPFGNNSTGGNNNVSPFGARQAENALHNQAVGSMLQDRAQLQQEQEQFDQAQNDSIFDQQAREERLRQFHALRKTEEEIPVQRSERLAAHGGVEESDLNEGLQTSNNQQQVLQTGPVDPEEPLSLTEQVQNAASAQRLQQQVQSSAGQPDSPWAKIDTGLPQPFPPPPSTSPLPAPAAQRNRQNVADALAAESRSQTQTPSETHTTSIAPWAREPSEAPKGPSLKEIQEAEARKAAKLEEVAAAARRALAEQERANQPPPVAPGLPSTANWASSGPQVTTGNSASVWSKPASGKPQPSTAPGAPKKTLAQIQKEEEARKQRQSNAAAAAAAASAANQQAAINPTPPSGGKRYADLASKVAPSNGQTPSSGAWTTVGAGGKVKQTTPVPTAAPLRSVPGLTPSPSPVAKNRPITTTATTTTRTTTVGGAANISSPSRPTEELTKWAKMALGKGLNNSINVDDFVQQLLFLPAETEIISDSVYANSQTLDGRRFAEEFIRRRKLADKGIIDPAATGPGGVVFGPADESKNSTDGWNEVAKKGNATSTSKEESAGSAAAFKVVSKKKGKR